MGFRNIFKKKEQLESIQLDFLKTDMHSHLIPGIDDGSKSMDASIGMLQKFKELGYQKVITTPHIMSDYFKNNRSIIYSGRDKVKEELHKIGLDIQLEAAAEYYYDEAFLELVKQKDILTFGDNRVLFEFPFMHKPSGLSTLFFELLSNDYKPVLAHFERYVYWLDSVEKAHEFREKGMHIQLNLNSLIGHYGPEIKKQAERMVDEKVVDFVGTDCHRMQHLQLLESNLNLPYMHKIKELELENYASDLV